MIQASVGFHCPECAKTGSQSVVRGPGSAFRPLATKVLIGLNLAGFLWGTAISGTPLQLSTEALADGGLIAAAARQDSAGQLVPFGVDQGEWWRLVTSGFLHNGLFHLGMNMALLWILGSQLERVLGPFRFVGVYVVALFAGSFGALIVEPRALTVGASGAVYGLMGVAVMVQRTAGVNPWASGIGGLIAINLFITFLVPAISVGGHIGGLLGGVIAGGFTVEAIRRRFPLGVSMAVLGLLALGFAVAGIWAATLWTDPIF